tara:strand:+ start:1792 stop:2565 length:774 start_codon:yes stop_codon:yes gene_type:complete
MNEPIVHIISVHWNSIDFLEIQYKYLEKYIDFKYEMWITMDGFKPHVVEKYKPKYDNVFVTGAKRHSGKLDLLTNKVLEVANDDDILLFLDSDSWPIAPVKNYILKTLSEYKLGAVKRVENIGDKQPHPCFCFTTVKSWKELGCPTWRSAGYSWIDATGKERSDVGGNVLKSLEETGTDWYPMLRSNKTEYHPVYFAIYDNICYHHGAGSRQKWTKYDKVTYGEESKNKIRNKNQKLSYSVLNNIERDFDFYKVFLK